jgi:alpha-N-arabinofuranosidase
MERSVVVHTDSPIADIRPELHGHFLEHLGTATYNGIWVGRDSPIVHLDGLRRDAVVALKELGVPVLRWPGGCFADNYHWRNGIGPAAKRQRTVNHTWGGAIEDNGFGTHEFMRLCELIGAQPYVAGNMGSGSPAELRDWVEYCNFPAGSTLSDERVANGAPHPFRVRFWGVGNESWACGGHMSAEEYAALYARFATFVPACGDVQPYLIAVGPNSNDTDWTRRFFTALNSARTYAPPIHGFAMHYYSWGKSGATRYTADTVRDQLSTFDDLERAIKEQRAYLDALTPPLNRGHIDLLIDEWGTWDLSDLAEEREHGRFWQQNTAKDAVAAALGLNVFHRQADKLAMCNIAQVANVLQAPLLTEGERCIRTPTFHAFALMKDHQGKKSLHVDSPCKPATELSVSASRDEHTLFVTLANPDPGQACTVVLACDGAAASSASGWAIHHPDMNACNTFDQPGIIMPVPARPELSAGKVQLGLPALSVTHLRIGLA